MTPRPGWVTSPSVSGLVLLATTLLGLGLANSPAEANYFTLLHLHAGPHLGPLNFNLSVAHWINDGLMSLFFLLLSLEIKREMTVGHLDSFRHAALPVLAALGGMAGPALIFFAAAWGHQAALPGWAIPVATDAAFTLPVVTALGGRIPPAVRAFLMALAIFDDVLAILIIAVFYTAALSVAALAVAAVLVAALVALNLAGVKRLSPYLALGALLWAAILQSGMHATLAGVLLGLCIPSGSKQQARRHQLPLQLLEHVLQPYVAFLILPAFGLANAGVSFAAAGFAALLSPVGLGAAAGLFFGKQLGVFGFTWAAIRLRIAAKPRGASYPMLYGIAMLCGIGFTISLFIGTLAFDNEKLLAEAKLGIFAGSVLSALAGYVWLRLFTGNTQNETRSAAPQLITDP